MEYDSTPYNEQRFIKQDCQAKRWKKTVGNKVRVDFVYKTFRRRAYIDLSRDAKTQQEDMMRNFRAWQKELSLPSIHEEYNLDD